ncbi:hypothetical protein [Methylobacterium sp. J-076]|uniref:hypothetical protein n=1 Tax=Methylobacterium sp. J-076 TaxID=2836655 RepID=UPI001FBBE6D9|nr:hypothetical protein [Methylobacterium sp. J-076]MCJ2010922.1 hypothetical protein [Methylobacterium sp. J-076]
MPFAQRGPVTIALAAMQAADPDRQRLSDLRRRIAERIEADIALLDALNEQHAPGNGRSA